MVGHTFKLSKFWYLASNRYCPCPLYTYQAALPRDGVLRQVIHSIPLCYMAAVHEYQKNACQVEVKIPYCLILLSARLCFCLQFLTFHKWSDKNLFLYIYYKDCFLRYLLSRNFLNIYIVQKGRLLKDEVNRQLDIYDQKLFENWSKEELSMFNILINRVLKNALK